jgi:hypothetical protein
MSVCLPLGYRLSLGEYKNEVKGKDKVLPGDSRKRKDCFQRLAAISTRPGGRGSVSALTHVSNAGRGAPTMIMEAAESRSQ